MIITQGSDKAIGIFDSGVGGLTVLKAIRQLLPNETMVYFGDQVHVPYGLRPLEEVQAYSIKITQLLLDEGAKIIVVACNTASAAALVLLREQFPDILFVGMEPAIKPAAEYTKTGLVGVLATPATFQGALYASVVERFAGTVTLIQSTCPGLVQEIELGNLNGAYTRSILESVLKPMLQRGIDTIVLGCTHFPFVIPLIQEIAGMGIRVIDPAPSVARQVARLLDSSDMRTKYSGVGEIRFITSGVVSEFELLVPKLIGEGGKTQTAQWSNGEIYIE